MLDGPYACGTVVIADVGGPAGGGPPTTFRPRPTRSTTTPSSGTLPPPPPTGYCPLAGFCRDFDAIDVIGGSIYAFKGDLFAVHF